ncbi:MAG: hypothetical protein EAZ94_04365 [Oscillatoriales cyanobacterium]|nr:MAG: hypothetical protein EAZ94_04365 [Oscillatoriales cyanobacterium]
MFGKILDLLPAGVVEQIGNASFRSLADRGEVDSWSVSYESEGEIATKERKEYERERSTEVKPIEGQK